MEVTRPGPEDPEEDEDPEDDEDPYDEWEDEDWEDEDYVDDEDEDEIKELSLEQLNNVLKAVFGAKANSEGNVGIPGNQYIAEWVGGMVQHNFENFDNYKNTCAITISLVLNILGGEHAIPYDSNGGTNSGDFNKDGTNEWYYFRAGDLHDYLESNYGESVEIGHTDNIPEGAEGFVFYDDFEGSDGTYDHIDYWGGDGIMGDDYSDYGGKVYFIRTN